MIFLTTGTQLSFDRLVQAVDEWADEAKPSCSIFGQVLPSPTHSYLPRNFETKVRLTPGEYAEIFSKASLIVSHAGMGTILTALTQGKQICILPRQAKYGEHRNDHQIATIENLKDYPGLYKARDTIDLKRCIGKAYSLDVQYQAEAIDPFANTGFTDKLRKFIMGT